MARYPLAIMQAMIGSGVNPSLAAYIMNRKSRVGAHRSSDLRTTIEVKTQKTKSVHSATEVDLSDWNYH